MAAEPVVTLAVLFFTFLPPVLAHAGLATTDMGLTAFLGAAFLAGVVWIEGSGFRARYLPGVAPLRPGYGAGPMASIRTQLAFPY